MKSVAIIPLRKGSKGIPGKNKKKILGRPLFQWCLGEAILSELDEIYIYTDDEEIREFVIEEYKWTGKVKALSRSDESASDTASTEDAMIEFAEKINFNFDLICLLQATSPLTSHIDINNALNMVKKEGYNSSISAVKTMRFIWSSDGKSLNYDYKNRPRRQDFDGLLIENGAVYVAEKEIFLANKNRLGGEIGIVEMPEDTLTEIDEVSDLLIIEKLLMNRLKENKKNPQKIRLLVLDVDGVFTDGKVTVCGEKELTKSFSLRDGMGLENIRNNNVQVMVMTSENSPIVKQRMEKLKIDLLFLGVKDKYSKLSSELKKMGICRNEVAYLGDDINDLVNINSVAWGACPNDAVLDVKSCADITLNAAGGDMAIREFTEFIINYNNRF